MVLGELADEGRGGRLSLVRDVAARSWRQQRLRPEYLLHELDDAAAGTHADRCGAESGLVQYQLLMHRPANPPLGSPPVLVLATPDDRLVPITGVRRTAARYGADVVEFPGMGHDMMLDARWREPVDGMLTWLPKVLASP